MSFDVYLSFFVDGRPSGVAEDRIRSVFGGALSELSSGDCWRVSYGSENDCSDISIVRDEAESQTLTGLTINRPVSDPLLWDSLFQIMLLGNGILYWPGSGPPLVANRETIDHLPLDMVEALGEPDVIERGADIVIAIQERVPSYLRRQRQSAVRTFVDRAQFQGGVADPPTKQLEWLDGYSGQSTDDLLALEGRFRKDSLVLAFEEAIGQKEVRIGDEGLTEEEILVLVIESLEREVNNGGYHQFFFNTSEYADFVVPALRRIGRLDVAAITQKAIAALRIEDTPMIGSIESVIYKEDDRRDKELQLCDEEYSMVAGCLAESLFAFIKAHRDKIKLP